MKDFDGWNNLKQTLDNKHKPPFFNIGQVWWCSVGINVGYEIYGKNALCNRPVLIIRKFSHYTFFGLPMTSSFKNAVSHFPFIFNGVHGSILMEQGRTFDARRLGQKIGELSQDKFNDIKKAFKEYL